MRGNNNEKPSLCFELNNCGYFVRNCLDWAGKQRDLPYSFRNKIRQISWNPFNFLQTENIIQDLYELFHIVEKRNVWTDMEKLPVDTSYLPPIIEPPLFFGLAGNCPMTWRASATAIPNYPIGYTRAPQTLTGHKQRVYVSPEVSSFRCAVELGVVLGRSAKNVSREMAMDYIAGYTIVNDMISNHWKDFALNNNAAESPSFEELLITSYYGRGTLGFAPVGPWVVSRDDIDNPYNLLMYSYLNENRLDRSHTNAMVVGIEYAIEYLSSFMTLPAGSIIHMGAMGIDGITIAVDDLLGRDDFVELEIEKIGKLRVYFDDNKKN